MESIGSREVFGEVTASLGEAPRHVVAEHLTCAYYLSTIDAGLGSLSCSHGKIAIGAFYSEDLYNRIRRLVQAIDQDIEIGGDPTGRRWEQLLDLTK